MPAVEPRDLAPYLIAPQHATQIDVGGGTVAAVLVALFVRAGELYAVFTRRRDDLRHHGGQISFPGGRRDSTDLSLTDTALREANEEIGLAPELVELLGALQPTPTIATNFAVYPFVGLIADEQRWQPAPREVDAVLELSLAELRAGYERRTLTRRGVSFRTDCYVAGEQVIWGATARMLADLLDRIDAADGASRPACA